MSSYLVRCIVPGCDQSATYKVAAPWSDGSFSELKTYGHACERHVGEVFRAAEARRARYRPAPGESVEPIGIFRCIDGWLDWQLQRMPDLEAGHRCQDPGMEGA